MEMVGRMDTVTCYIRVAALEQTTKHRIPASKALLSSVHLP